MKSKSTGIVISVLSILAGFPAGTTAQSSTDNSSSRPTLQPTKQNAVDKVIKQTGGRVLDVKKMKSGSKGEVWRVKFIKDGRIRYMDIALHASTN